MKIEELSKISINNKELIENSKYCACYYCLYKFEPKDIIFWTDNKKTALCPKCNVDSVIGDNDPIDSDFLQKASKYWF